MLVSSPADFQDFMTYVHARHALCWRDFETQDMIKILYVGDSGREERRVMHRAFRKGTVCTSPISSILLLGLIQAWTQAEHTFRVSIV